MTKWRHKTAFILTVAVAFFVFEYAVAGESKQQTPCEKSGYKVGTPESNVCVTLVKLHPPLEGTDYFHAVHRSISLDIEGIRVSCHLEGGMTKPVSCESRNLIRAKVK
jgi:hypothetical protein